MIVKIFIILFLLLMFYLYIKSKNNFFFLPKEELEIAKNKMIANLKNLGRDEDYIDKCIVSYDWFSNNPERYDGSTIVLDLCTIYHKGEGLEVESMNHDYDWIHGANRNFFKCWKSNWVYYKDLKRNGKGRNIGRLIGLTIISIGFVPIMYIKYKI